ncbi:hypothetical protein ACFWNN_37480 [Lentzea sp. NPDC058450]|uniref:hypothetical protein n=1 Tax=Lentzea sp. NPDC058450 TaxID=3346505 RepID=UPI003664AD97
MTQGLAAFHEELAFEPPFGSVATLADDAAGLTCSVTIGRQWARGRARSVVGYPAFELAADGVREGRHDVLLVPSAYPEIRTFFFDPVLHAVETFLGTLPDMVFAVPEGTPEQDLDVVYHHPATRTLVETLGVARAVHSSSNSAACREAVEHDGPAGAVTNQTSADHYGLRTVKVLSAGTPMGFVVFRRKDQV